VSAAESALSSAKVAVTSAASSAKAAASSAAGSVKQEVSSAVAADPTTASVTAPTGAPLASVASVESAKSVVIGEDKNAVLLASSNGTVVGHTAVCTHQGCIIAATGICPCHNSKYDVQTGAVIAGANGSPPSSQQPLAEVPVTVFDGQVYKA
jgi:nitrite reductase/ring-hydroxylating ferredoxin subunit